MTGEDRSGGQEAAALLVLEPPEEPDELVPLEDDAAAPAFSPDPELAELDEPESVEPELPAVELLELERLSVR